MDAILSSEAPPLHRPAAERILRGFAGSSGLLILTVPAPDTEPAALLAGGGDAFAYLPPAGPSFAGLGTVATLKASGEDRFATLAAKAAGAAAGCEPAGAGCAPLGPHFFGGLAFAPGAADAYPWTAFGDASFVLPRWLYRRAADGGSTLSLTLRGAELSEEGERRLWLARLQALSATLAAPPPPLSPAGAVWPQAAPLAETRRRLQKIGRLLAAGKARKLVTALRLFAELERPDPPGAFRRLAAAAAGTAATPFFFRRGGTVFLGASPELLVARDGGTVRSEAVAGSWRCGLPLAEFLASAKIAEEHELVAEAIAAALGPCCRELAASGRELRRLGPLAHLATRFEGSLATPRHLFELAARLHPTPAVGSSPAGAATALLAEIGEPPRGWYAAPVGYCDGRGGGELRVALRSALLRGRHAWLHAGAGIVAGSSPEDELAEMLAKTRPMLAALGENGGQPAVHEPFIASSQTHGAGRADQPHLCQVA